MSEFEEMLEEVGTFGPFQVTIFILVSLFEMPAAWAMVLPVFTAATPMWECQKTNRTGDHSNASVTATMSDISQTLGFDVSGRDLMNMTMREDDSDMGRCELLMAGRCQQVVYQEHFTSIITEVRPTTH